MSNLFVQLENDESFIFTKMSGGRFCLTDSAAKDRKRPSRLIDPKIYHYVLDSQPRVGQTLSGQLESSLTIGRSYGISGTWKMESPARIVRPAEEQDYEAFPWGAR